jgi:hypothetical protein
MNAKGICFECPNEMKKVIVDNTWTCIYNNTILLDNPFEKKINECFKITFIKLSIVLSLSIPVYIICIFLALTAKRLFFLIFIIETIVYVFLLSILLIWAGSDVPN